MEHRIEKGENVFIHSRAYVAGNVTLGDNANVWCGACIRGDLAPVKIGGNTNVQDNATVHVGYNVPCEIGFNVTVGHNAVVHGCTVEDGVLIGMGSTVLNGAVIGKGSVVAAGALVLGGTVAPPNSLVAGVPAKVKKTFAPEEVAERIAYYTPLYVEEAKRYAAG